MPSHLVQLIIAGAKVLGRAFGKAVKEEYASSQQAARNRNQDRPRSSSQDASDSKNADALFSGISLQEAKQILNIQDLNDLEEITKRYNHLFNINDRKNGGSLYIQSKVFRAKERIDHELKDPTTEEPKREEL